MSRQQQLGLSMVEVMIAILIGLLLLAGIARIFLSSKQGYRVQESAARLQENRHFALETLSRSIRMADFWAGVAPVNIRRADGSALSDSPIAYSSATGDTCGSNRWLVNPLDDVHGHDGTVTGLPAGFDCVHAQNY